MEPERQPSAVFNVFGRRRTQALTLNLSDAQFQRVERERQFARVAEERSDETRAAEAEAELRQEHVPQTPQLPLFDPSTAVPRTPKDLQLAQQQQHQEPPQSANLGDAADALDAVENITPLQKTSHMLCSWATADTGVASLTKCVQTDKSENYALPKNEAVGGHFATASSGGCGEGRRLGGLRGRGGPHPAAVLQQGRRARVCTPSAPHSL